MASDELSQKSDIQMAYTPAADGNPWLMLSSNKPGATIVKIEIFDEK